MPRFVILALTAMCTVALAIAGDPWTEDPASQAAKICERREQNRAVLAQYSWKQRTEVEERGKLVSQAVELVRPTADGGFEKTPIAESSERRVRGPIGKASGRKRGRQQREWHAELDALLLAYSLPTADDVQTYLTRAKIGPGDMTDTIRIRGRDVVKPGDELTMWVDAPTRHILRTKIVTRIDEDLVTAEIDYRNNEGGFVFKARETVQVPSHKVAMTIERFAFTKQSPDDPG